MSRRENMYITLKYLDIMLDDYGFTSSEKIKFEEVMEIIEDGVEKC